MAEIRKNKSIGKCFHIDLINLENLYGFLNKDFETIDFMGRTADGAYISFKDFVELKEYNNYYKNRLLFLTITCKNDDKKLELKFKGSDIFDKGLE